MDEYTVRSLTAAEMQKWNQLKEKVIHKSVIVYRCKNEQTYMELDNAIGELMEFENLHGIE